MKKLMILSIMISLFAFWGSKNEVNIARADECALESETAVTFFDSSSERHLSNSDLKPHFGHIVNIKISNKASDLPLAENYICDPIKIEGCIYTDASGNTFTPSDNDAMRAYLSHANSDDNGWYDCVLYANVSKIYASNDSSYMFSKFINLQTIDVTQLDTSNVTNMSYMFSECSKLSKIELGKMNTMCVTNMDSMFYKCASLTEVNLSSFDTSLVTNMSAMFTDCTSLTTLNLQNFDTSEVTHMGAMFRSCSSLVELNVSNFDTSNVRNFQLMFSECSNLIKLDLSNFDLTHCCDSDVIFGAKSILTKCHKLEYLKCPKILSEKSTADPLYAIELPTQFSEYYGVKLINSENLSQYKTLCIPGDEFAKKWRALRTEGGDNGICAFLTKGTANNDKLNQLLTEYDVMDKDYQEYLNTVTDKENVTVGESITYVKNVLNGSQTTNGNYNGIKDDAGSYMTTSITEESPYLIAVISLLGVIAVIGYYFYNKKQAN